METAHAALEDIATKTAHDGLRLCISSHLLSPGIKTGNLETRVDRKNGGRKIVNDKPLERQVMHIFVIAFGPIETFGNTAHKPLLIYVSFEICISIISTTWPCTIEAFLWPCYIEKLQSNRSSYPHFEDPSIKDASHK